MIQSIEPMTRFKTVFQKCLVPMGCLVTAATASAAIGYEPRCPATIDPITIVASGPTVQRDPLSLEVKGSTIKLVAQAYDSGFSLPPGTRVEGTLPAVPAGTYRIEFYTRQQPNGAPGGNPATLLPERFVEAINMVVYQTPPTCAAANVEPLGANFFSAAVGDAFPGTIGWRVTDAHGNPVPNHALSVRRVGAPHERNGVDPLPNTTQANLTIVTGPDGIASLAAVANSVPGAFQYSAEVSRIDKPSLAYLAFYNQPGDTLLPDYPVVEFVRQLTNGMQHFFLTGNPEEMAKLDDAPMWARTGAMFMTFRPGTGRAGTNAVCRFYGLPEAGLDSHFFSAAPEECEAVSRRFPSAWKLETSNAFEVFLPDRDTGICPEGTRKLHRSFNNRADANHRYALTQEIALLNAHPYDGPYWSLEGYGLEAVVMCLPR